MPAATAEPQVNVRSRHRQLIRRTRPIAEKNTRIDYRPPTGIIWDYGHIREMDVSEWRMLSEVYNNLAC